MKRVDKLFLIKQIFYTTLIAMLGCVGVVFCVLYIETFESGVLFNYSTILKAVSVALVSLLTIITLLLIKKEKSFIFKLFLLLCILIAGITTSLYLLKISGFLNRFKSIDAFRQYVSSFGGYGVFIFIVLQFLQVVVLPIPAFITVGAGVLLFGPFYGALYSCVGIIIGSIVAYFIGRIFGFKVAKWLVGEQSLKKGINTIKGKDRLILTFMFLFPFFPDDLLCFVAGLTTVTPMFFIIMIFITRIISVFVSSYSMNNSIIPYNTWWGILLWVLFFAFTVVISILIYKKGNVLEYKLLKRKKKDKSLKNDE